MPPPNRTVPTVFLDGQGAIRGFTPDAAAVFGLAPGDCGRPFPDVLAGAGHLELRDGVRHTLETGEPAQAALAPFAESVNERFNNWLRSKDAAAATTTQLSTLNAQPILSSISRVTSTTPLSVR